MRACARTWSGRRVVGWLFAIALTACAPGSIADTREGGEGGSDLGANYCRRHPASPRCVDSGSPGTTSDGGPTSSDSGSSTGTDSGSTTTDAGSAIDAGSTSGGLRFNPPVMASPYVIHLDAATRSLPRSGDPSVSTAGLGSYLPPTLDVIVCMPRDATMTHTLVVRGGRNVRIIGGHWVLAEDNVALAIDAASQSYFIEGAHIDINDTYADAIAIRNRTTSLVAGAGPFDTTVQNVLVEGVYGIGSGVHGDIIQNQSETVPIGSLFVENLTGETRYQGFFIPPRGGAEGFAFVNVDLRYGPSPVNGALLWLRDSKTGNVWPGTLDAVYVSDHPVYAPWYDISVWPKSINSTYNLSTYDWPSWGTIPSPDGSSVTFHATNMITGQIHRGAPPGGSFVRAENVGTHYVSPHPSPCM